MLSDSYLIWLSSEITYPSGVIFPRSLILPLDNFLSFKNCLNLIFLRYISFSYFNFLGCENTKISSC